MVIVFLLPTLDNCCIDLCVNAIFVDIDILCVCVLLYCYTECNCTEFVFSV